MDDERPFSTQLCSAMRKPSFWLEFLGLLVVSFYAYQAWRANKLTRAILVDTTRPIIAVSGILPESCVCATVKNLGRNTAIAQVRKGSVSSLTRLSSGPRLRPPEKMIIPSGDIGNRIDFDKPGLSRKKDGWFYLSARIDYGDGLYTRFCREFQIDSVHGGYGDAPCQDPMTNDAK